MSSAVINLATNAGDAMPQGGRLIIETAAMTLGADHDDTTPEIAAGDYIQLTVSDNGIGIKPADLPRVFEPFFSTKPTTERSGLGLSMVFGFIRQSEGHIRIESEIGKGTTIRIFLPRAGMPIETVHLRTETSFSPSHGGESVLVVEDNDPVRRTALRQIETLGYQVHHASDGESALAMLDAHPDIDLLFTDMIMPGGMNGKELALQAQARHP